MVRVFWEDGSQSHEQLDLDRSPQITLRRQHTNHGRYSPESSLAHVSRVVTLVRFWLAMDADVHGPYEQHHETESYGTMAPVYVEYPCDWWAKDWFWLHSSWAA